MHEAAFRQSCLSIDTMVVPSGRDDHADIPLSAAPPANKQNHSHLHKLSADREFPQ
jgi:hypothetical protein